MKAFSVSLSLYHSTSGTYKKCIVDPFNPNNRLTTYKFTTNQSSTSLDFIEKVKIEIPEDKSLSYYIMFEVKSLRNKPVKNSKKKEPNVLYGKLRLWTKEKSLPHGQEDIYFSDCEEFFVGRDSTIKNSSRVGDLEKAGKIEYCEEFFSKENFIIVNFTPVTNKFAKVIFGN